MLKKIAAEQNNTLQTPTAQIILEALQGIRYGAIEIVVHDGRIVQIERKEKLRVNIDCSLNRN